MRFDHVLLTGLIVCRLATPAGGAGPDGARPEKEPVDYVNPFIGTGDDGHTFPGAVRPFGMIQPGPDTEIRHYTKSYPWCAGYRYSDPTIIGFSHTHFSGTGHSDLGDFLLMPVRGEPKTGRGDADSPGSGYRSRFSHEQEWASPGYYGVVLSDYGIKAETTATKRTALHRYSSELPGGINILLDMVHSIYEFEGKVVWSWIRVESARRVTGCRQTRGWGPNRSIYFAMEFSRPVESYEFIREDETGYGWKQTGQPVKGKREISGLKLKSVFRFGDLRQEPLLIKISVSGVDAGGAIANLREENPGWDFESIRQDARTEWNRELGRIQVEGSPREKTIFYTALYHAFLSPAVYQDVDGRYRGLDHQIHKAGGFVNHTVFSLWDTFRAAHPLFTILQPGRDGEMIQSMLEHYRQSAENMLPVWSYQGNETWCMIGYHAVPVIADAYLKGIRNFDSELAFRAMLDTAGNRRYDGLDHYIDKGWVAIDREEEAASKTLEYAYDDWTIAQMAAALGKTAEQREYLRRAANYRNVYDPATGFMRARKSDGSWNEPFDPLFSRYGGDYTEGNAWQYTWFVPHDVEGLIRLMGGPEKFVEKLDRLFLLRTEDEKYRQVEDISGLIGQYAHGNEPSQHIAYLYNFAGRPWRTQERIHQIMKNLFDDTPEGICGNEDCGQMSAWYLFSAMGFYPVCPAGGTYVIGRPALAAASLQLENGKVFRIRADHLSDDNLYIQQVLLNGKVLTRSYLLHREIMAGGELVFQMGKTPNRSWAAAAGERPPSMTPAGNE